MLYLIVLNNYAYTKSSTNKKIERIAVFEFENNRLDKEIAKTLTDRLRRATQRCNARCNWRNSSADLCKPRGSLCRASILTTIPSALAGRAAPCKGALAANCFPLTFPAAAFSGTRTSASRCNASPPFQEHGLAKPGTDSRSTSTCVWDC